MKKGGRGRQAGKTTELKTGPPKYYYSIQNLITLFYLLICLSLYPLLILCPTYKISRLLPIKLILELVATTLLYLPPFFPFLIEYMIIPKTIATTIIKYHSIILNIPLSLRI